MTYDATREACRTVVAIRHADEAYTADKIREALEAAHEAGRKGGIEEAADETGALRNKWLACAPSTSRTAIERELAYLSRRILALISADPKETGDG